MKRPPRKSYSNSPRRRVTVISKNRHTEYEAVADLESVSIPSTRRRSLSPFKASRRSPPIIEEIRSISPVRPRDLRSSSATRGRMDNLREAKNRDVPLVAPPKLGAERDVEDSTRMRRSMSPFKSSRSRTMPSRIEKRRSISSVKPRDQRSPSATSGPRDNRREAESRDVLVVPPILATERAVEDSTRMRRSISPIKSSRGMPSRIEKRSISPVRPQDQRSPSATRGPGDNRGDAESRDVPLVVPPILATERAVDDSARMRRSISPIKSSRGMPSRIEKRSISPVRPRDQRSPSRTRRSRDNRREAESRAMPLVAQPKLGAERDVEDSTLPALGLRRIDESILVDGSTRSRPRREGKNGYKTYEEMPDNSENGSIPSSKQTNSIIASTSSKKTNSIMASKSSHEPSGSSASSRAKNQRITFDEDVRVSATLNDSRSSASSRKPRYGNNTHRNKHDEIYERNQSQRTIDAALGSPRRVNRRSYLRDDKTDLSRATSFSNSSSFFRDSCYYCGEEDLYTEPNDSLSDSMSDRRWW